MIEALDRRTQCHLYCVQRVRVRAAPIIDDIDGAVPRLRTWVERVLEPVSELCARRVHLLPLKYWLNTL